MTRKSDGSPIFSLLLVVEARRLDDALDLALSRVRSPLLVARARSCEGPVELMGNWRVCVRSDGLRVSHRSP